eukprot:m.693396 g.693396  ORF g.693396 m.693396 type:complete len:711 (+) comp22872_c0_seq3:173-2305(+)
MSKQSGFPNHNPHSKDCKRKANCKMYYCTFRHPPGRKARCKFGDSCKKLSSGQCHFLHPPKSGPPPPYTQHPVEHLGKDQPTTAHNRPPHQKRYEARHKVDASGGDDSSPDTLMKAMEIGMKRSPSSKSAKVNASMKHNILCSIASDPNLAEEFFDYDSAGEVTLTKEMIHKVTDTAGLNVNSAVKYISLAQNVSLCFVVDTTGSMDEHICAVREQIVAIIEQVQAAGCKFAGIAFVGYKDWSDGEDHCEVLPFPQKSGRTDIVGFKTFVSNIKAGGGGDFPEDVLGGLAKAVGLTWNVDGSTRIIFHICDAPPHGTRFYTGYDDFPDGHPKDPTLEQLFGDMRKKEIMYYFGKINSKCDKMIEVFSGIKGDTVQTFDTADVTNLTASVTASVMESVSTVSDSIATRNGRKLPQRKFTLSRAQPNWRCVKVQEGSLLTYDLKTMSVESIVRMEPLKTSLVKTSIQIARQPFDKGSVRLAYWGRRLFKTVSDASGCVDFLSDVPVEASRTFVKESKIVLKEYLNESAVPSLDSSRYLVDMETQTVAAKLALDFNNRLGRTTEASEIKLKFLVAKVLKVSVGETSSETERYRHMAVERQFNEGAHMVKYTNNYNFVRHTDDPTVAKHRDLAVAYSHFTYDFTNGYLIVVDVQGVEGVDGGGKDILLLTDPAIHCARHHRFGVTNLRQAGIDGFFKTHKCNKFCSALGLTTPK